MGQWTNGYILVVIRITDPDTDPDSYVYRDTGKTALAEVYTIPVLLVSFVTSSAENTVKQSNNNTNNCSPEVTLTALAKSIVVTFELFELCYWLELYELYYKRNKVHKVHKVNKSKS